MKKAFTLIELLVVIAIVGIIGAIMLPAIGRTREAGRRALCANNLRQLYIALMTFENDTGHFPRHYLPDEEPIFLVQYLDNNKEILRCPSVKGYYNDDPPIYSYGYFLYTPAFQDPPVFNTTRQKFSTQFPVYVDSDTSRGANWDLFAHLIEDYGTTGGSPADFDHDGDVDFADFNYLANHWTELGSGFSVFRHNGRANIIYFDGHIDSIRQ